MNTNTQATIAADVFIVPNQAVKPTDLHFYEPAEYVERRRAELCDKSITTSDLFVQVWVTSGNGFDPSSREANWVDHKLPEDVMAEVNNGLDIPITFFPYSLPVKYFAGKREGDTIEVKLGNATIQLHLAQTKYRYSNYGKFEEVLATVTRGR